MPRDPEPEVIRNLFRLQRLANGISVDARRIIEALFDDIAAQLARIDPTSPQADRWRRARVRKLLGMVQGDVRKAFDEVYQRVRSDLAALGADQSAYAASLLATSIGAAGIDIRPARLGLNAMKAILDRDPIQGELLRDWFKRAEAGTMAKVRRQIQLGMSQNETIDDMVRRIRGKRSGSRFVGGVMETTTRQAEAVVRTAVTDVANLAHLNTYRENADVVTSFEYTATLDSRTTPICAALDGQTFPLDDDSAPRPPQHVNCRSSITPIIDWDGLGLEAPPEGTRASADGQVKSSVTYEQWLRRQPASVQAKVLGVGKAKEFRAGKTIREIVRADKGILSIRDLAP